MPLTKPVIQRANKPAAAASVAACLAVVLACAGCSSERTDARKRITPEYDKTTGKLQLLTYDSDGNGKADTFSYMDGARVLRIEIDKDENGQLDRWEYYDSNQKIEKIGFSRLSDGKEDAWLYTGPDASIVRIEVSTKRDGKVTRIEHYDHDKLLTAEEDSNDDGRIDKWETYDGERLASVAFDTGNRGTPDRRLVYGSDGTVRIEVDPTGEGHFTPAPGK
jgi:hypothetical protein